MLGLRAATGLALVSQISTPGLIYAKGHGEKLVRMPEVVKVLNSQTMDLLEGYLNTNPTGIGGGTIAIVDSTALSSSSEDGAVFLDEGQAGGQISVYVVRSGDTLSSIAKMYGVSTNTILWANDIRGTTIKEGDELVILPISGVRHTVKKGDTLQSIAGAYKADLDEILAYNDVSSGHKIVPGDIILVPNGEINAARTSTIARSPSSNSTVSVVAGYFMRPISGGRRSQGIHGHNGIDIAASVGTPIVASADGKVIISRTGGYNGGYGTYVVISHANGTQTLYAHMSKNNVSVGQSVKQGQTIGAVGNTGRSTGPHIHFEVRGAKNPF